MRTDLLLGEADELLTWAADDDLRPPVALLGHVTDDPRRAAYWPFAVFSPEWQAIRWAVRRGDTFPGLSAGHLRVAVRDPATSRAFGQALAAILEAREHASETS